MQAITKVFSDIVKPYIDATDNGLINNDFTNGAVNLFPVTATTQTVNGITFTVNSDGTITANGTSTTDFSFSLYGTAGNRLFDTGVLQKGKSYKISGTPSGMPTTVYMYLNTSDGATRDNGDGAIINSTSSTTGGNFAIVVNAANVTLNNVIFKPMITVADMPDSDYAHYVPYAMSNQELTSENQTLQNQIAGSSADIYSATKTYYTKDYVFHDGKIYKCIQYCAPASWEVNQNCFAEDTLLNALVHGNLQFVPASQIAARDLNYYYGSGAIFYQIGNISLYENRPLNAGWGGLILSVKVSDFITQIYFGMTKIVYRHSTDGGTTWTAWINDN